MTQRMINYIDEANRLDRELNVIGELAEGVLDAELLGQRSVSDLGTVVRNYVVRGRALRQFFLEQNKYVDSTTMESELARLAVLYPK